MDSTIKPKAKPEMAVAFTCPSCGHRNFCECIPIEMTEDDLAEAREQGVEVWDRSTEWAGTPDEADCAKCGVTVDFGGEGGRSYVNGGGWIDEGD